MGISWQELIIVLLIVLVVFGPKRLPEIGSSLGRGLRGFKDGMNGRDQLESSVQSAATQQTTPVSTPASTPTPVPPHVAGPHVVTAAAPSVEQPTAASIPVEVVDPTER